MSLWDLKRDVSDHFSIVIRYFDQNLRPRPFALITIVLRLKSFIRGWIEVGTMVHQKVDEVYYKRKVEVASGGH